MWPNNLFRRASPHMHQICIGYLLMVSDLTGDDMHPECQRTHQEGALPVMHKDTQAKANGLQVGEERHSFASVRSKDVSMQYR